ncbi:MAG: hypothetical protein AAF724_11200 [Pseudomonadota bacterium]
MTGNSEKIEVLPPAEPGLTAAAAKEKVLPLLAETLFTGGATSGWWLKSVQLRLEAKGMVQRANSKPMRLHLAK